MDEVRLADLKANLREYLRVVRRGQTLMVLDQGRAIARIIPYDGNRPPFVVRTPRPGAPALARVPLPPRLSTKVNNIVELLAEDRQQER